MVHQEATNRMVIEGVAEVPVLFDLLEIWWLLGSQPHKLYSSNLIFTSSFFLIPLENDDWLFSSHVDFVIMICLFPQKAELLAWGISANSLGPHWKTHILLWESVGCLRGCNTGQRMVLKTVYGYRRRSIWVVLDPQKLKQRLKGGLADENYPVSHHKNLFFFFLYLRDK